MSAEVQAHLSPGIEVVAGRDCSAHAFRLADGPILLKGLCAVDGGGVGSRADVNVVRTTITGDGSLLGSAAGRVVGTEGLDDVILRVEVSRCWGRSGLSGKPRSGGFWSSHISRGSCYHSGYSCQNT